MLLHQSLHDQLPVTIEWYVSGSMVEITVLVNVSIKPNYVYSHSLITYVMEFKAGIWFDGFRMLNKWKCFYYYCKL